MVSAPANPSSKAITIRRPELSHLASDQVVGAELETQHPQHLLGASFALSLCLARQSQTSSEMQRFPDRDGGKVVIIFLLDESDKRGGGGAKSLVVEADRAGGGEVGCETR